MPDGVFSYVICDGIKTGLHLVKHPGIKAVGFTGSYKAGMTIFKAATNEREYHSVYCRNEQYKSSGIIALQNLNRIGCIIQSTGRLHISRRWSVLYKPGFVISD